MRGKNIKNLTKLPKKHQKLHKNATNCQNVKNAKKIAIFLKCAKNRGRDFSERQAATSHTDFCGISISEISHRPLFYLSYNFPCKPIYIGFVFSFLIASLAYFNFLWNTIDNSPTLPVLSSSRILSFVFLLFKLILINGCKTIS